MERRARHIDPRRRNHQRVEPLACFKVGNAHAVHIEVAPPLAATAPADAGNAIGDLAQTGAGCRLAILAVLR